MRKFFYIVILSLISGFAAAQPQIIMLNEDPFRSPDGFKEKHANARTTSFSVNVDDTLKLPFFEDFSSPYVPTSSVDNLSSAPLKIHSVGLHGLKSGDQIHVFNVTPLVVPELYPALLNSNFYVKVIDPFSFELFSSATLGETDSFPGNDEPIEHVMWSRLPYDPNVVSLLIFPDTLKWENNSGVYINDRYAINPPSYNVATFDGLDQVGVPYSNTTLYVAGYNDKLTSLPIEMAPYDATDNVYLTFYWQKSGYGEDANSNDFLALEFKNDDDVWTEVWRINANAVPQSDLFYKDSIQITNADYFFDGFQFRFRNYGSKNGPFDIWNLDYIYLDQGRVADDNKFYYDWAISEMDETFLKNYSAMPYQQFFADVANETLTSLNFSVYNLGKYTNSHQPQLYICNESGTVLYNETVTYGGDANTINTFTIPVNDYAWLTNTGSPRLIHTTYHADMNDEDTAGYRAFNNLYQKYTILWDYYAYDDGSAEYGFATNLSGSAVTNRFELNIDDILTHTDICFVKQKGSDMTDRIIFMEIYNQDFSTTIYSQPISISYSNRQDGFVRYAFDAPIPLAAGVYNIGYKQNLSDRVVVGFDANIDHADRIFFFDGLPPWQRFSDVPYYIPGSLMIRPVFDKGEWLDVPNVTPIEDQLEENYDVVLYPNPSSGEMNLEGDITHVTVYDLYGRIVLNEKVTPQDNQLYTFNLSDLAPGMYMVHVSGKKGSVMKKLILDR